MLNPLTTQQLILSPLLVQFVVAIVLLAFWRTPRIQRRLSVAGSFVALVVGVWLFARVWNTGLITLQAGNWPAPFGITFVTDMLSATLILLTALAGLAVSIYSTGSIDNKRMKHGYFPIFHFLLLGLNGAFLTGDIFNLYVWFEVIIISSFVLLTIGGTRTQLEGAMKYFTLNMLASIVFLTAIAVLYGLTGTLNMADLSLRVAEIENRSLATVCGLLFLVGFGIKSALFPLYFWLPASYHTPPSAVSAIFGGLLTKVGVYALIRVFTLIFVNDEFIQMSLMLAAVFTILGGGISAFSQNNLRKAFSYLIICHIGFMVAGLGMFTELALVGAVFYLIHDIVVKTNLFMVSGLMYRITGSNSLRELGGLYEQYPRISLLMAIPLFSLVGIPPLSGFWPKVSLILASAETGEYLVLASLLIGSFLTLAVVAKVWAEAFWKKPGQDKPIRFTGFFHRIRPWKKVAYLAPIVLLAVASLYIGFFAEHVQQLAERIASELMNPEQYIQLVLPNLEMEAQ